MRRPIVIFHQGFTLLEILIAVSLLAVIGTLAASLLHTTLNNQAKLEARTQALNQLQIAFSTIRRDLEQVADRQSRDEYLGETRLFQGLTSADSSIDGLLLAFTKHGRRQLGEQSFGTSLERIRYRLVDGELTRESSPILDPAEETRWHQRTLLIEVEQLSLRYLRDGEWSENGMFGDQPFTQLPQAVALQLSLPLWSDLELIVLLPDAASAATGQETQ